MSSQPQNTNLDQDMNPDNFILYDSMEDCAKAASIIFARNNYHYGSQEFPPYFIPTYDDIIKLLGELRGCVLYCKDKEGLKDRFWASGLLIAYESRFGVIKEEFLPKASPVETRTI